jgi:hypothetical protein
VDEEAVRHLSEHAKRMGMQVLVGSADIGEGIGPLAMTLRMMLERITAVEKEKEASEKKEEEESEGRERAEAERVRKLERREGAGRWNRSRSGA